MDAFNSRRMFYQASTLEKWCKLINHRAKREVSNQIAFRNQHRKLLYLVNKWSILITIIFYRLSTKNNDSKRICHEVIKGNPNRSANKRAIK